MNTEPLNNSIIVYIAPLFGDTEAQLITIVDLDLTDEQWFEALNGIGEYATLRNALPRSLSVGDVIMHPDGQYSKVESVGWSTGLWFADGNLLFADPNFIS